MMWLKVKQTTAHMEKLRPVAGGIQERLPNRTGKLILRRKAERRLFLVNVLDDKDLRFWKDFDFDFDFDFESEIEEVEGVLVAKNHTTIGAMKPTRNAQTSGLYSAPGPKKRCGPTTPHRMLPLK